MKEPSHPVPIWTDVHVKNTLPSRTEDAHKGSYGSALLMTGSVTMSGAALLAGRGAMRSGLEKLEIATEKTVIPVIVPALPEATYISNGLDKISCEEGNIRPYKAAAIGAWHRARSRPEQAINRLQNSPRPLILNDQDGFPGHLNSRRCATRMQ